ncbi:hypothetical protein GCM10007880_46310 [Mesorhizobium amorphae]|uniref:Uncharacterized protein n=1 Tax=Mesorhizobium amorphae CCNWGS0123 TaxID=1082933 RepID=G6Y8U5_9HYPH|nr:hypothetical protein MEA186_11821 [Mesorhizobium amorphae CCNWGS0123]GLR44114.1 hypothetical protein GCM10007880_46310 [Mesorhizobium amorphae]
MRSLARTATVIASIAMAIVLTFMAAKGFELTPPDPIVAHTFASNIEGHDALR